MKTTILATIALVAIQACDPAQLQSSGQTSKDGAVLMANQTSYCMSDTRFTCSDVRKDEAGVAWMHCDAKDPSADYTQEIQNLDEAAKTKIGWFQNAGDRFPRQRILIQWAQMYPGGTPFPELEYNYLKPDSKVWVRAMDASLVSIYSGDCK